MIFITFKGVFMRLGNLLWSQVVYNITFWCSNVFVLLLSWNASGLHSLHKYFAFFEKDSNCYLGLLDIGELFIADIGKVYLDIFERYLEVI